MADTPRPDTDLLAELGPLRALIAEKLATTPVRLGHRGGTDELADVLTLAVAVYVGRDVLPADALALARPPRPAETEWTVETLRRSGAWVTHSPACHSRDEIREDYDRAIATNGHRSWYRLVRATTTYAVEAEHTPEQPT